MKFTKLSIDGYGRFAEKDISFDAGLQIVAGPNERGKSTLRHFITDMLYGQKRGITRRIYEESNELRTPWKNGNGYGGRLAYLLDSGVEFEVHRCFDPSREVIQVYDLTNARDVTGDFPSMRNRESTFAEHHLNMTKSVFSSVATISHLSLADLGDKEALLSIREKLLSLTDSGSEDQSAEQAIKSLSDRIAAIGQPTARTKPLPVTRQRLMDLQAEYQEVHDAATEVTDLEFERGRVRLAIERLTSRRGELERELGTKEANDQAALLHNAEDLEGRINEITKQCFALGAARDFPLQRLAEVQRAATLVATIQRQIQRTNTEIESLSKETEQAIVRLEKQGVPVMKEPDAAQEARLDELDDEIGRLGERIKVAEQGRDRAKKALEETQGDLEGLPDFSKVSSDPVEFYTQLASRFDVTRHTCAQEHTRLERIQELIGEKKDELESSGNLFEDHDDFIAQLRTYEHKVQEHRDLLGKLRQESTYLTRQAGDLSGKFPGFVLFSLLCLGVAIGLGLVAWLTDNNGIFMPAAIVATMFIFFSISAYLTRSSLGKIHRRLEAAVAEEESYEEDPAADREFIQEMMDRAECDSPRELEGLYDKFHQGLADLTSLEDQLAEQESRAKDTDDRVAALWDEVCSAFESVGEKIENHDDVQPVSMRVLSRYQAYRDAKRRTADQTEELKRSEGELNELSAGMEKLQQEDLELSLKARKFLRKNHYPEEENFSSALKALRGYRIRSGQTRQKQGELEVAQGQMKVVRRQMQAEQTELAEHQKVLKRSLSEAGVKTVEEFLSKAKQAQEYEELWKELTGLQGQLETLLRGRDLLALREQVAEQDDVSDQAESPESIEALRAELSNVDEEFDALRKQEHGLHIKMTERAAGLRTVNEVDEERAATERRLGELELELQAATYSISVIEEVTRKQHARIAPQLAELASGYLKEITVGVYEELLVDRDMQISVRIPQTKAMKNDPDKRLSKGTVDQIYFALRLAMIQSVSKGEEAVPMVLDDPFANYDDERLAAAIDLLSRLGESHQILLFTCREDVVRAGEAVGARVLRI